MRFWLRFAGAAVALAVLVWRLGTGPFIDGLRTVDAPALGAAAAIALLTTACCAWRWQIVARCHGIELPLPEAVASYYRSLFLNLTLPGGVVGDVHRGVNHGIRPVVWERCAGQLVQAVVTVAVLLALPSPLHAVMPLLAIVVVLVLLGVVLFARRRSPLRAKAWVAIAVASAVVLAGHVLTFVIAARTAGADAPLSHVLPLALLALAAAALPNVGGWGPREGATAWLFGAAGLGAQLGVATAVVYGVMALAASLPGAAVLVVAWFRRTRLPWQTANA